MKHSIALSLALALAVGAVLLLTYRDLDTGRRLTPVYPSAKVAAPTKGWTAGASSTSYWWNISGSSFRPTRRSIRTAKTMQRLRASSSSSAQGLGIRSASGKSPKATSSSYGSRGTLRIAGSSSTVRTSCTVTSRATPSATTTPAQGGRAESSASTGTPH